MGKRPPLKKSEGYKLCKLMGSRCGCEERGSGPCQSLVMHLHAARGDANVAFANWKKQQGVRAEFETR